VTSHTENGISYQMGEFVQLTDVQKTIMLIERLEVDSKYGWNDVDVIRNAKKTRVCPPLSMLTEILCDTQL